MSLSNPVNDELEKLISEINPLIERINNEYNKFFGGAEKFPPIKLLENLEKLASRARSLQRQCQNHGISFRLQGALSKYTTYKAMWDKKMLSRERA